MNRFRAIEYLLLFFFTFLFSCTEKTGNRYIKEALARAEAMLAKDSAAGVIKITDSLAAKFTLLDPRDKFRYYSVQSDVYRNQNSPYFNLPKSELFADSAIYIIEHTNLESEMSEEYVKILRAQGFYYIDKRRYTEGLRYIYSLKVFASKRGDSCLMGEYNSTLGTLCYRQANFNEALGYYKESLKIFALSTCYEKPWKFFGTQGLLDNIGLCYKRTGKQDSAIQYFQMAETYIRENKQLYLPDTIFPYQALAVVYGNRGHSYVLKGEYENAIPYYERSIRLNSEYGQPGSAMGEQTSLATLYLRSGEIEKAEVLLKKVEVYLAASDRNYWGEWYDAMAQLASKKNNLKDQSYYLKEFIAWKDSVAADEKKILTRDFGAEYNVIEKRHEIDILKQNNRIQDIYITAAIAIVALLLVLAFVIFRNLSRSRKMVKLMEKLNAELADREENLKQLMIEKETTKEKERRDELFLQELRLQMEYNEAILKHRNKISNDMHDGLTGSLAALKYYVEDIKNKIVHSDGKELLTGLEEEVTSIYENARLYMHSLRNNTSAQHNIPAFLTDISHKFSEKNLLDIHLDIDTEKIGLVLTQQQQDHLYHILKESISNIIKHAKATQVTIAISFTGNSCSFIISDNGKGFNEQEIIYGMGLKSIRTRLKELEGELQLESNDNGTRITGTFPVHF